MSVATGETSGDSLLALSGVKKQFARPRSLLQLATFRPRSMVVALDGVDLEVAPGEIVGLMGPNGAGKTTLIKILAGLVLPDSGAASVSGHAAGSGPARASVGLVTAEERSFYWRISGRENLRFFATLHRLDKVAAGRRIDALVEELQLGDVIDQPVRVLSTGNRGRLALARGLLHEPRVLLLDEVSRALDPGATRRLRRQLRALVDERGLGALWATHDLSELKKSCDRVALLDGGRVVAAGDFEAIVPAAMETFELEAEDLA